MTLMEKTATIAVALTLATAAPATLADEHSAAELPSIELARCARFEQQREMADLDVTLDSAGYFLRQDDALIWQTTRPVADRVRLSPDNPDLPRSLSLMLPVLTGLLDGNWQALRQHFAIDPAGESGDWQARLTPLDAAVAERLERIDASGGQRVERLNLAFANGDRVVIRLTPTDCDTLQGAGHP
ncbi:MAG: outer membrane lipoprotein carrier protein LolA [Halomonas sp.]|nr:outer membrane lipoprotein carrier protein LolA [Halomonas sp.]MDN6298197.1 outer membrane lipoprotein carrier protein LolA [Halomonas sp.]MDN6314982.1 outer membrane lipoprotein carrier protein LolA [Halomonas sp.]MDN6336783.1 outer membrane lipoprotein carrier protein LolA [Halomonas sp.]